MGTVEVRYRLSYANLRADNIKNQNLGNLLHDLVDEKAIGIRFSRRKKFGFDRLKNHTTIDKSFVRCLWFMDVTQ